MHSLDDRTEAPQSLFFQRLPTIRVSERGGRLKVICDSSRVANYLPFPSNTRLQSAGRWRFTLVVVPVVRSRLVVRMERVCLE